MKIAFVLFEGLTLLDFVGFYDSVTRIRSMEMLPDFSWDLCAMSREIRDDRGLVMRVDQVRPDLGTYDAVFVPGGYATRELMRDEIQFLPWLRTAEPCGTRLSVCTGSLLLGAAGFLKGLKATTHPQARDLLRPLCGTVVPDRIVRDGNTWTGGGVASSLDLGLAYGQSLVGTENRLKIQGQMDYPHFTY